MENAADALKIAFAMLVFVVSISMAFMGITQAVDTSNIVVRILDRTEFYPEHRYVPSDIPNVLDIIRQHDGMRIMSVTRIGRNRIVGVDTIISNLYRYAVEHFAVIIRSYNGDVIERFDLDIEGARPWTGNHNRIRQRINDFLSNEGMYAYNGFADYISSNIRFREEFVEIMVRGEVERAPDGSEIITRPPVRKIFLIYTAVEQI